jgi:hypothetical protein
MSVRVAVTPNVVEGRSKAGIHPLIMYSVKPSISSVREKIFLLMTPKVFSTHLVRQYQGLVKFVDIRVLAV